MRQALAFLLFFAVPGIAAPVPSIPKAAEASARFDPVAATDAYLASVPAYKHARSDAYFEGGYWLILWDFLVASGISILLLQTGLSARMRDAAGRITRSRTPQTAIYWIAYSIVTFILAFPLTVYEGFFREHQYGLANQTFAGWMGDQLKGLMVSLILSVLLVTALFAIVRRLNRTWHIWGAIVSILFLIVGALIGPVFILPLFNKFTVLNDPRITAPILSLARANGIPVAKVYEVDASRQSKRVSANVSGFLGTERITLNDNLLNRCSPPAILAVMGHEMGHYVMNHVYKVILFFAVAIVVAFTLLRRCLDWSLARWGARWRLEGIGDVAVLPLAALVFSVLGFLFTPFGNKFIRTQEYEADMYGLNAARQPDGFAESALLLGEYRKLDPGRPKNGFFSITPAVARGFIRRCVGRKRTCV